MAEYRYFKERPTDSKYLETNYYIKIDVDTHEGWLVYPDHTEGLSYSIPVSRMLEPRKGGGYYIEEIFLTPPIAVDSCL